MSKRKLIIAAIKASLEAASPGVSVRYWKDHKAGRTAQIAFRDIGSKNVRVNNLDTKEVHFALESIVLGDELGDAMNDELDRLIKVLGDPSTLAGVGNNVVLVLGDDGFDDAGNGHEVGIVDLAFYVSYRVPAWSGT